MKRLMEYELEGGGSVLVQVNTDDYAADELIPAASPDEVAAKATQTFEQSLGTVKQVAQSVMRQVEAIPRRPDEVTVAFGLTLAGSVNFLVASGSAEATLNVTLTWKGESNSSE